MFVGIISGLYFLCVVCVVVVLRCTQFLAVFFPFGLMFIFVDILILTRSRIPKWATARV